MKVLGSCQNSGERFSPVCHRLPTVDVKERKGSVPEGASVQVWIHQTRLEPSEVLCVKAVSAWLNPKINTFALSIITISLTPWPSTLAKKPGFQCDAKLFQASVIVLDNFTSPADVSRALHTTMNKHVQIGKCVQKRKAGKKINPGKLFRAPFPPGCSAKQFNCS